MKRTIAAVCTILSLVLFSSAVSGQTTLYASLYERSPVGNPYDYFGALDADTKAFVQKIADETVRKFFGR